MVLTSSLPVAIHFMSRILHLCQEPQFPGHNVSEREMNDASYGSLGLPHSVRVHALLGGDTISENRSEGEGRSIGRRTDSSQQLQRKDRYISH